jgi:hypothetical protein
VVRGGESTFVVSDEGAGVAELTSAGIRTVPSDRMIRAQIKTTGLRVSDGVILSPMVPMDAIPAAILIVANASRTIAEWGIDNLHYRFQRNFREDLQALLGRHFHDNLKNDEAIVGKSNTPHKFGYVVHLSNDRRLLIDPVINEASSINARLASNLDVRLTENPLLKQIIVYDDAQKWKASHLKLLELGAPTVAFSRAEAEITRLAA